MRRHLSAGTAVAALVLGLAVPVASAAEDPVELVPGTAVLLANSGGSGGGGTSSTSSTNIFSPSVYVDYKRFGGEPTGTVDRYPFPGLSTAAEARCPSGQASCFKDIAYVSGPNGFVFPHYSPFFKSGDRGESFRIPAHVPGFGKTFGQGGGGGDSHQVVGRLTHKVFFVDLPGPGCVTMNVSDDLGENWRDDELGCGTSPGAIDDRQWVEADETFPGDVPPASGHVYVSFINFTNPTAPTLGLARSLHDGAQGSFATDSVCNTLVGSLPADAASVCPDPADDRLWVAGPPVADDEGYAGRPTPTHRAYIPFVRAGSALNGGPPWELWVAISDDGGSTWTRHLVAERGANEVDNIFPQLTVDRGGNIYYTWSETQSDQPDGEQDVYYASSTDGGRTWSEPIDLTKEQNDSAVLPWMVAGDPGRVDLVYYRANTGLNSNVGFVDAKGNPCPDPNEDCGGGPNPSVWNVYFAQSLNALNKGADFKAVQISDHPNHLGQICTSGTACEGDRDLLDFFTVDVDHLGAANVAWADDNTSRGSDTRNKFSRQLAGTGVYKNQTIAMLTDWPVKDHAVADSAGDSFDAAGEPAPACPGMDVLGAGAERKGDAITISLTLDAPPTAAEATACGKAPVTGGVWGAEFWAASDGNPQGYGEAHYIGYRDNPPDGAPHAEAGRMDNVNATVTSLEYHPTQPATLGGNCFATPAPAPCTITMTASAGSLGIKPGSGLYSITGLATFYGGTLQTPPAFRIATGNSEQADAAAPFDIAGTGTTK